jgi:hypothetical protein
MSTAVGNTGLEGVPSLEDICSLYRSIINDDFSGTGQINKDSSPWMKPFLNSALRDLYSDLRISGDMRVVKDNYILNGLPPLTAANPEAQCALTAQGYFNGTAWNANFTLPPDFLWMMKVWQRPSNTGAIFHPMQAAPSGLPGNYQGDHLHWYEMRAGNQMWFNGALQPADMRLRYMAIFPDIIGDSIDFSATFVPIQDCTNAVAMKMVAYYCQRLSPDQFSLAEQQAEKFTKKLINESILNSQLKEFQRLPFGSGDCQ